jgi:hypothetical protein
MCCIKKNIYVVFAACFLIILSIQFTKAATRNWIGTTTSNDFSVASNWHEGIVPIAGDVVQVGVSYKPKNTLVLSTAGTTSIGSLTFGTDYNTAIAIGITVNSGSTLSVTGDITFETNSLISASSSYAISGGGTITANNMYIDASGLNLGDLFTFYQTVNCSVNSLVLSGNLSLTSEIFVLFPQLAYFNLTAGTTEVDGNIVTNNTIYVVGLAYPTSYVIINPSSSTGATLQLNGAAALSTLSANGTNVITFNNNYSTVNYAGTTQIVYTTSTPNTSAGISYYNLTLTGSGTKTAGTANLDVSNNLTLAPPTTALTFDLNFNSTISAIGNFTSNTLSTLIQGSGKNFVVSGTATNNGIINLAGNSTMFFNGTTGLTNTGTISGLSGYGSQQNITVANGPLTNSGTINWYGNSTTSTVTTAALMNSGTINQLSLGTITASGLVTNSGTINKSYGLFLATAGFTNSTGGVFNGTTITGTGGYTYITGAFLNNGTLTCNAETIYFGGNYTNNNIFTAGTGMVYFSASTPTLVDNSTPGTLFNNVTFNGSGTATMVSGTGNFAVSAIGSLYMVSPAKLVAGTTTVGGAAYLTLMSGASSTATAYTPSGTTITGNVNVQRYITSGSNSRGYRLLCSPVNVSLSTSGAGNLGLSYLNANASFGGTTYYGAFTEGPGTGFTTNGSTNPIIYLYDESRPTDNSSFVSGKNIGVYAITGSSGSPAYNVTSIGGKPAVTTSGVSIPVGNSYLFYFVGSNQSTIVSSSRIPDATTLTATGYLNQGNVPVTFWKTNSTTIPYDVTTGTTNYGINQIGNPYASTINLNTLYSDNYNATTNPIGNAYYELIPGGNYVTYNASNGHVSDTRASQYIVSGQGFLIQATGSSPAETITFKEDQKAAYNASATLLESIPSGPALANAHMVNSMPLSNKVKNDAFTAPQTVTADNNAGLHLQLVKDSADYAQTGIYFSSNASDAYVKSEDAAEIDGGTPVVYLSSYSSDSVKLSINNMGAYGLSKRIRLYDNATTNGIYTFSLYDITGMDTTNYNIYLVDNLQKDSIDLLHYKTYSCNLNPADTNSVGSNRFVLAINHKPIPKYLLAAFWGQKMPAGVQLNWTAVNAGTYTGYTLQKLNANACYDSLYTVQSDTTITTYNFIDTHPIIGNNVYRLKQNGITGAITYSANVTVGYNSTAPTGTLTLYPNPAQNTMNVSLTSSTINTPVYLADIYITTGKLIKHESVSGTAWSEDVSSYKLGIYIMQIKDTNGNIIGQSKFEKVN